MSIDPKTRRLAKSLYLEGRPPKEIADELSLNINTLMHWIDKGSQLEPAWKAIRAHHCGNTKALLESPHIEASIEDVRAAALNVVARSLAALDASGETLDVANVDRLMSVLDRMDRIQRGHDVDSEEDRKVSLRDLQEKINEHPFLGSDEGAVGG